MNALLKGITAWLCLAFMVLGALTMVRLAQSPGGETRHEIASAEAVAVPTGCERRGPISEKGAGYFWLCRGDVREPGEQEVRVGFGPDEVTPADEARPVAVRYENHQWRRDADRPYKFLLAMGYVLLGSLAFMIYAMGVKTVAGWFVFREEESPGPESPAPPDEPAKVAFPIPDDVGGVATWLTYGYLFLNGLALIVVGGTMTWATRALDPEAVAGFFGAVPFAVMGLGILATIPYARRTLSSSSASSAIIVEFAADGIRQPIVDGTTLVLPWTDIQGFVFDEHADGLLVTAQVTLTSEAAVAKLAGSFRRSSRHGRILSSQLRVENAERAAKVIEELRPGIVRWPVREIKRGGFGIARAVKQTIIRFNRRKAAKPRHTNAGPDRQGLSVTESAVVSRTSDRSAHLPMVFLFAVPMVVTAAGIVSPLPLVARVIAAVLTLVLGVCAVQEYRNYIGGPTVDELVLDERGLTRVVEDVTEWVLAWEEIEQAFLRRKFRSHNEGAGVPGSFQLVLRPSDRFNHSRSGLAVEPDGNVRVPDIDLSPDDAERVLPVLFAYVAVGVTDGNLPA